MHGPAAPVEPKTKGKTLSNKSSSKASAPKPAPKRPRRHYSDYSETVTSGSESSSAASSSSGTDDDDVRARPVGRFLSTSCSFFLFDEGTGGARRSAAAARRQTRRPALEESDTDGAVGRRLGRRPVHRKVQVRRSDRHLPVPFSTTEKRVSFSI